MNTSVTVYKASAGSGKTFTLTSEYIKKLIEKPDSYRNILAVTFTNKATEEMKMRILSQLYGISKQLPDSQAYFDKIKAETNLPEAVIKNNASTALTGLLHNYSYFQIQTIDTFFQSILRNLARELELTANLKVSLNDTQVMERAVDEMLEGLQDNSNELKLVMEYINSKIENDKTWNVVKELKTFGKHLFKDLYKENEALISSFLNDKNKFANYKEELKRIEQNAIQQLKDYQVYFEQEVDKLENGIKSFKGGNNSVASFTKKLNPEKFTSDEILTATQKECLESTESWFTKKSIKPSDELYSLVETKFRPLLQKITKSVPQLFKNYNSCKTILKNLYQLRLLSSISCKVTEINNENNQFLLSNTQTLLNKMIEDQDAPFIFEKVGTRIDHIMIDEFQDTSTSQWKSFQSLLKELVSAPEKTSLIVGDVKQSIYRWRSGDWRLLNNIKQNFASMGANISINNLTTNYRSCRNIIEFNNAFFANAIKETIKILKEGSESFKKQFEDAYADVEQQVPNGKPKEGYVEVKLYPKEASKELIYSKTKETIEKLLSQNVAQKDIAILIRSKNEIDEMAAYLSENMPHLSFLSEEAFKLSSSSLINIIINALRYLVDNNNMLALTSLVQSYQISIKNEQNIDNLLITHKAQWQKKLPIEFVSQLAELKELPLINVIERISKLFSLEKMSEQSAYLCTFIDLVSTFIETNGSDLNLFLKEWDEELSNNSIETSGTNGITLMTIHKSKGLEFDHLIMPFCNWRLEMLNEVWLEVKENPYNAIPIIPVNNIKKNKKDSIFKDVLAEETFQNTIDNLNLLYVAFTRACKNLFIFVLENNTGSRDKLIADVIKDLGKSFIEAIYEEESIYIESKDNNEKNQTADKEIVVTSFTFGEWYINSNPKTEKTSSNVFLKPENEVPVQIQSYDYSPSFMQSNQSKEFVEDNENELQRLHYIKEGNIFHSILSNMQTLDDLDKAIEKLEIDGVLYTPEWSKNKLKTVLKQKLNNPKVAQWFSKEYTIFNECTILYVDEHTGKVVNKRPDRVIYNNNEMIVIDFKTGNAYPYHQKQVKQYMTLLKEMGYNNITGYLWYLDNNNIENVK